MWQLSLPVLTKTGINRQTLLKLSSIKFHDNSFSSSWVVTWEHTHNTDMVKLIGVFFQLSLRSQKAEHEWRNGSRVKNGILNHRPDTTNTSEVSYRSMHSGCECLSTFLLDTNEIFYTNMTWLDLTWLSYFSPELNIALLWSFSTFFSGLPMP
jgi:hypothetical protein